MKFHAESILSINDNLPIRADKIHSGKVRSVYWLSEQDSKRLIKERQYNTADNPISEDAPLAVMVISDRISAFECLWHAEGDLNGVPGKGTALNTISHHWFNCFQEQGLAANHILESPHPLVWIVQKAKPVMVEAIARQYITGSMWRSYSKGERVFCGNQLPEDLQKDQRLSELLLTPSTKGILTGIPNVPESDDVNISKQDITKNYQAFGFQTPEDIKVYEKLLKEGFSLIGDELAKQGQLLVDTKFEFGYVKDANGEQQMIYMDEVGTPDSSRIWDESEYQKGNVVENSKEPFRQAILEFIHDSDIITNKERFAERKAFAKNTALPSAFFEKLSETYIGIAEKITGKPLHIPTNPKAEIIEVLRKEFDLIT